MPQEDLANPLSRLVLAGFTWNIPGCCIHIYIFSSDGLLSANSIWRFSFNDCESQTGDVKIFWKTWQISSPGWLYIKRPKYSIYISQQQFTVCQYKFCKASVIFPGSSLPSAIFNFCRASVIFHIYFAAAARCLPFLISSVHLPFFIFPSSSPLSAIFHVKLTKTSRMTGRCPGFPWHWRNV